MTLLSASAFILSFGIVWGQESNTVFNEQVKTVSFEHLNYPVKAKLQHVEGIVVVEVRLDPEGKVSVAKAISGPRLLVAECEANAMKWRFRANP